jgi:2-dehydro-3-deoxyphosphogluconate aldolase/(4S)-4-hydroxy-2-oxoglutarate aldolase
MMPAAEVKKKPNMREEILESIIASGAVAVVRMSSVDKLLRVVEAVREGGVTAIEITMTTPNALQVIEEVSRRMDDAVQVGVGSVLSAEVARQAVEAGARYVVSPIFKPEIIRAAHAQGVPAMPGAFTPTEVQLATEAGADIVKVFPADVVGMAFFKAVRAPMPHLKLMPTGGVTLTNAGDWIRAGACAVGVGSALLDRRAIEEEDYAALTENARTLRRSVEAGRS